MENDVPAERVRVRAVERALGAEYLERAAGAVGRVERRLYRSYDAALKMYKPGDSGRRLDFRSLTEVLLAGEYPLL